jgi:hypothetical protein
MGLPAFMPAPQPPESSPPLSLRRWSNARRCYTFPPCPSRPPPPSAATPSSPAPAPLHAQTVRGFDVRWTPDGTHLLYALRTETNNDIFTVSPGSDSAPVALLSTPSNERAPSVSPDGKWLLFQSARGSASQIFVRQYPGLTGIPRQVSSGDGSQPMWSKDGREIFYLSSSDSLMSVSVLPGPTFTVGAERGRQLGRDAGGPPLRVGA